jgi:hypothetical protein
MKGGKIALLFMLSFAKGRPIEHISVPFGCPIIFQSPLQIRCVLFCMPRHVHRLEQSFKVPKIKVGIILMLSLKSLAIYNGEKLLYILGLKACNVGQSRRLHSLSFFYHNAHEL